MIMHWKVTQFKLLHFKLDHLLFKYFRYFAHFLFVSGLGFKIDEIIQAWNEMYEAKKWQSGIPSFRLEPLLRRRVSKLYSALENALKDSSE